MSDLSSREVKKLERLFGMSSGYVLNFSNRTFSDFFSEFVGKDIDDARYEDRGTSKANRLRSFWAQESNSVVAKCLQQLVEHANNEGLPINRHQLEEGQAIISRLDLSRPVADIEAISAVGDDRDFDLVAKAAAECIERNQPEQGLDRLHTFLVKFIRKLCEERGLSVTRDMPLNGIFGAYVKRLAADGHLGSEMTERILKSSIANLEQFNYVRNNHTLAHDNPVLTYDESLLIFNYVASTVRFVKSLEERLKNDVLHQSKKEASADFDIPF